MESDVQETTNVSPYVDLWIHEESKSKMIKVFMDVWESKEVFFKKTFDDCVLNLKKKQIPRLRAAVATAENEGRDQEAQNLAQQIQDLKKTQVMEQ